MCRSKSKGGRRCTGRTTATKQGATSAAPAEFTRTSEATQRAAFLRDNGYTGPIDAAGNATATTARTTDGLGRLLSEKGARFFALREAGYTGPLDQDSNPTDAHADVFAALDQATKGSIR